MVIPLNAHHQPTIRVAYADDHLVVREGISSLIERRSLLLPTETIVVEIQAENGNQLLQAIELAEKKPDVCLLDINMPEMNGFETIVELKKRWPDMGVLVFTIFDLEHYLIRMMMCGANGYLLKNCKAEEMIAAIVSIHYNGMYYPDHATMHLYNEIRKGNVKLPQISPMEMQLLKMACTDLRYEEIAEKMKVSAATVEALRSDLFKKLNVTSRVGLAMFAVQTGLVPVEVNTNGPEIHHGGWR